ncbi:unnamed protein product [Adineta ricciae]|nr:unnamed protein product [Adineta ricciae]
MKSQVLTLLLLTIGAHLFQSTHQYRLRKRELTEYHLTSFIVSSCSADKIDMFTQTLCDQTLQSALMGQFPVLMYYCKVMGSGSRYCDNLNRYQLALENVATKRFASRRFVRAIPENKRSYRKKPTSHTGTDFDQNLLRVCMEKTDESPVIIHRICNHTLDAIEQGQYPEIKQLCKSHPGSSYCRVVLSSALQNFLPSSKELSSSLSSLPSPYAPDSHLTSVKFDSLKMSDVDSNVDQQRMNKNTNKLSLL